MYAEPIRGRVSLYATIGALGRVGSYKGEGHAAGRARAGDCKKGIAKLSDVTQFRGAAKFALLSH